MMVNVVLATYAAHGAFWLAEEMAEYLEEASQAEGFGVVSTSIVSTSLPALVMLGVDMISRWRSGHHPVAASFRVIAIEFDGTRPHDELNKWIREHLVSSIEDYRMSGAGFYGAMIVDGVNGPEFCVFGRAIAPGVDIDDLSDDDFSYLDKHLDLIRAEFNQTSYTEELIAQAAAVYLAFGLDIDGDEV